MAGFVLKNTLSDNGGVTRGICKMDGPSKSPQLKVIKRIMYGRNSFELLKAKVLLHEQFRCEIN